MDRSDGSRAPTSAATLDRRQFLRGIAATGAVASAGGLLAACGGASTTGQASTVTSARKRGGGLKVGLSGSSGTDTLDPHAGLTHLDTARAQALYQPLVQLNSAAQSEYVLAESITPNKTTSEWIIRLRQGVTFHDGKPLTAQDVIYTFRRIKTGNKGGSSFSGGNSLGPMNLSGLKALDSHTVLVPFTSPYGSFLDQLAYWYYLYIMPDGFNPASQKPNGTGPFMYESFSPEQQSVFTRNKNFWKSGRPYVDTLTIIDFQDNTSLQDALITGVIHAAGGFDGPELASLATAGGVNPVASHTGAFTPFTMRVDQPPFHDANVRQALRLLVDRPQLIDSGLAGYGVVASDVFSPYDPDFDHSLRREADIEKARSLLRKAGQENLTVTLVTSAAATGMVSMATVLTGYLNWPFSQDFYNYSPYLAQVAQSMLQTSPFNETHTNSPTLRSLYKQANETISVPKRKQIVQEMQQYDFTQGGYIVPAYIDALDAYSTKITGYSPSAIGQPLSAFDFENWSFV